MNFSRHNHYVLLFIFVVLQVSALSGIVFFSSNVDADEVKEYSLVNVAFFYDPECPCSDQVMGDILPELTELHPGLNFHLYSIATGANLSLSKNYFQAYNVPYSQQFDLPFIFVGDHYYSYEQMDVPTVSVGISQYGNLTVPLWPEWEVTWTTEMALFYNSSSPFLLSTGEDVYSLVNTLDLTHIRQVYYDISGSASNLTLLGLFWSEYGVPDEKKQGDAPVLFIGNNSHFLLGHDISTSGIDALVSAYAGRNTPLRNITLPIFSVPTVENSICVLVFYSPTCGECHRAREFLRDMNDKYGRLNITEYNIADPTNEALKQNYFVHFDVPRWERGALCVIVGEECYYDYHLLVADLEEQILKYSGGCDCIDLEADGKVMVDMFESFGVIGVLVAGAIDGVNPCAFVTLIFFVSYLTARKKSKREILVVGGAFTTGVFVTYLAMGMGLYRIVGFVRGISVLSALLYPLTGLVALVLGIFSIYDYYKVRRGRAKDISLQLPGPIKKLTRKIIREHTRSKYLLIMALVTGIIISLLEFMCTGQVYLPTIVYIMGIPGYGARAFFYLVLYNVMFILPLLAIFLAVYFGASSKKIVSMFQKKLGLVKLLLAGLFFSLAIFMFIYTFF